MKNKLPALMIVLLVAASLFPMAAMAYDVEVFQESGDPSNRIDLVIMGDGYRQADQTKLTNDVNAVLASFWLSSPYGEYRSFFNVKVVHVISNQNGADNGSYGASRDTALGAFFNCGNIDRLLCIDSNAVYNIAASDTPDFDIIMVIVNDPKYGGSGGDISVFSTDPSSSELCLHELGHSFGILADEYEYYKQRLPRQDNFPNANVTSVTQRDQIKWRIWIDSTTPVPTPETSAYQSVVGLFHGAAYQSDGAYRPKLDCKMRTLGVPFCEVCAEALVLVTYGKVSPIDSTQPASPIAISQCEPVVASVTFPMKTSNPQELTWTVDGAAKGNGFSYTLEPAVLGDGSHQVKVQVSDPTPLVRNDPSSLLEDEFTWTVNVSGSANCSCNIQGTTYLPGTLNPQNLCQKCDPGSNRDAWSNNDNGSCELGTYCTGPGICAGGSCVPGNKPPCNDDGLSCTNTCDEASRQCNTLVAGFCLIEGACYADQELNPVDPAKICLVSISTTGWSDVSQDPDDPTGGCGCRTSDSGLMAWTFLGWAAGLMALRKRKND